MKKYFIAALVTFLLITNVSHAQTDTTIQNPAEVYVKFLVLRSSNAQAGAVIDGAFTLINGNQTPVSNISYHILLLQMTPDGSSKVFDDQTFGPESLKPGEKKPVHFNYAVPSNVSGKYTLRVRAVLASGFKMGWTDAPFTITGGAVASKIEVSKAVLVVGGKEYNTSEGPTIYPTDNATYTVVLKNTGNSGTVLRPTLSVFEKSIGGKLATTTAYAATTIGAGKEVTINMPLPSTLPANSYETKVELLNEKNTSALPILSFRYIVGGQFLTFQSVATDKNTARSGDTVTLTIDYTGTPADITKRAAQQIGPVDLTVQLTNEKNEVVATEKKSVSFDQSQGQQTISVKTSEAAKGLSVNLLAEKNGVKVTTFSSLLSVPDLKKNSAGNMALISGIVILALLVLGYFFFKNRKNPPMNAMPMAIFFLALVSLFGFSSSKAEAFTVTASYNKATTIFSGQDWRPHVFINSPYGVVAPGAQFYLEGDVDILACHNKPSQVGYLVKYLDSGTWKNMGTSTTPADNVNEHYSYSYSDGFRCGSDSTIAPPDASGQPQWKCLKSSNSAYAGPKFTAPTQPGTYRIYLTIFNNPRIANTDDQNDPEANFGWVQGYQEFTVGDVTPTVSNADIRVYRQNQNGSLTSLPRTDAAVDPYIGHWSLDAVPTITDSSANGNTGTVIGSVTSVAGEMGNAANFNGAGKIFIPHGGGLDGASEASFSLWVKWNGIQPGGQQFGMYGAVLSRTSDNSHVLGLGLDDDSNPNGANPSLSKIKFIGPGMPQHGLQSDASPGLGWHHIAVVVKAPDQNGIGGYTKLYVDGVENDSTDQATQFSPDLPRPLQIGAWDWGNAPDFTSWSKSSIDDVRVYPRALTAAEVATLQSHGDVPVENRWATANDAKFYGVPFSNHFVAVRPDASSTYPTLVGSCTYPRPKNPGDPTDCNVTIDQNNHASCFDGLCYVRAVPSWGGCYGMYGLNACVDPDSVTKVVFQYNAQNACPIASWESSQYNWPQAPTGPGDVWPVWSDYPPRATLDQWFSSTYNTGNATTIVPTNTLFFDDGSSPNPGWHHFGKKYHTTITRQTAGSVPLFLRSDDDTHLFVNGVEVATVPGVHSAQTSQTSSINLNAGVNNIDLYYADRWVNNTYLKIVIGDEQCSPAVENILVRRVGKDGSQTNPPFDQGAVGGIKLDAGSLFANTTEHMFAGPSIDTHTSYASTVTGYRADVGVCWYTSGGNECPILNTDWASTTPAAGFVSTTTKVFPNMTSKVVFKYFPDVTAFNYSISGVANPPNGNEQDTVKVTNENTSGTFAVTLTLVHTPTQNVTLALTNQQGAFDVGGPLKYHWETPSGGAVDACSPTCIRNLVIEINNPDLINVDGTRFNGFKVVASTVGLPDKEISFNVVARKGTGGGDLNFNASCKPMRDVGGGTLLGIDAAGIGQPVVWWAVIVPDEPLGPDDVFNYTWTGTEGLNVSGTTHSTDIREKKTYARIGSKAAKITINGREFDCDTLNSNGLPVTVEAQWREI